MVQTMIAISNNDNLLLRGQSEVKWLFIGVITVLSQIRQTIERAFSFGVIQFFICMLTDQSSDNVPYILF